jgi:hypothetical protein
MWFRRNLKAEQSLLDQHERRNRKTPNIPEPPVPPRILASLERYRDHGVPVGGFLKAVLGDKLLDAVCRADPDSLESIRAIAMWVHWELPSRAHGSAEAIEEWVADALAEANHNNDKAQHGPVPEREYIDPEKEKVADAIMERTFPTSNIDRLKNERKGERRKAE